MVAFPWKVTWNEAQNRSEIEVERWGDVKINADVKEKRVKYFRSKVSQVIKLLQNFNTEKSYNLQGHKFWESSPLNTMETRKFFLIW